MSLLGAASPVLSLAIAVIEPSFETLLVATIGATPLTEPSLTAATQAAIALPTITADAEKKQRTTFAEQTKTLPQNHFAMRRHACSQAALDNGDNSWQVRTSLSVVA